MATTIKDGFRATERDLEMVAFGGRHRGVEGQQFAERFGMHLSNAHRRLGGLVRRGLLDHRRLLHGRPGIYIATSAGLDFVGLELPPARPDLRSYEHDIELVWLALELEREFGADAVVTEREIRSAEMPAAWDSYRTGARLRPRRAVPTGSSGAPRGLHFPDLVVEGGAPRGGSLAVELERTSKGAARRREIVAAYRDATQFEQVRYYGTAETLRGIERSVADERANKIERVFDLRAWHPRAAMGLAPVWLASSLVRHHHHEQPGHHRHHGVASQPVPFEPLTHWLNHVMPSGLGAAALSVAALALAIGPSRLRWTWCVPGGLAGMGLAAVLAPVPLAGVAGAAVASAASGVVLRRCERDEEEHGGPRRRRARVRREHGPLQMLRTACERRRVTRGPFGAIDLRGPRRRRRPWQRSGPRMVLGIDRIGSRPVWLGFTQLEKHVLILGATGSGKSNTLVWMASRAIRAGHGAVVLDMKGDPGLRERLAVEAGLNGRPFYVWQIEAGGQSYNPLKAGDATAKRDRLTASQTFGEDYYRGLFSTHSKVVLDALEAAGRETTIAALREFWDPQDLKGLVRAIDDEDARETLVGECERLTRQQSEHVVSLRARLAEVADTTAGQSLRAGTSEADEIDLRRALERRAIVVFSINSDVYPGAAATIGNLILQDLVGVVGGLRQARIKAESVLAVDEFGALSGDQLGRLLSTARDVGLPTLLAGQDLAQLRRVSPHFEAEVKANVSALIAHRQSEPDSAEQIARMCGTEEVVAQTRQVDHRRWPGSNGQTGHETGVGSQHHERQFRVQPDEIKDLDTGEAVVRLWNPGSVQIARMYRCETTDEAAALATVTRRGKRPERVSVQEIIRVATRCRERLTASAGEAR